MPHGCGFKENAFFKGFKREIKNLFIKHMALYLAHRKCLIKT